MKVQFFGPEVIFATINSANSKSLCNDFTNITYLIVAIYLSSIAVKLQLIKLYASIPHAMPVSVRGATPTNYLATL